MTCKDFLMCFYEEFLVYKPREVVPTSWQHRGSFCETLQKAKE